MARTKSATACSNRCLADGAVAANWIVTGKLRPLVRYKGRAISRGRRGQHIQCGGHGRRSTGHAQAPRRTSKHEGEVPDQALRDFPWNSSKNNRTDTGQVGVVFLQTMRVRNAPQVTTSIRVALLWRLAPRATRKPTVWPEVLLHAVSLPWRSARRHARARRRGSSIRSGSRSACVQHCQWDAGGSCPQPGGDACNTTPAHCCRSAVEISPCGMTWLYEERVKAISVAYGRKRGGAKGPPAVWTFGPVGLKHGARGARGQNL